MPRTESGPATRKGFEWDYSGRVRISEEDHRDARFKNTTTNPPRSGKLFVGPARDIERSNLTPRQSVFDGKPGFDLGFFLHDKGYFNQPWQISKNFGPSPWSTPTKEILSNTRNVFRPSLSGETLSATCEGASCGGNISAKITAKFCSSYEKLLSVARRPINLVAATVAHDAPALDLGRAFAAAIMRLKLFRPIKIKCEDGTTRLHHMVRVRHNGRPLPYVGPRYPGFLIGDPGVGVMYPVAWFGGSYPRRWDQAASRYLDIRIDGKATNGSDITWSQAAARIADEASGRCSTTYRHEGRKCPSIFFEKPQLCIWLFWLMAGLDAPLSDFWFFVAEPPSLEKEPRRYCPSNIYEGRLVSLNRLQVNLPRLAQFYRECFRRLAQTVKRPAPLTDRDRMILKHWRLIESECRKKVPKAERKDATHACVERLLGAYDKWNPALGAFTPYAEQAIEWEIQNFMEQLRQQVPVQRSINLNDPTDNRADEDEDNPERERSDMMTINSLETQAAAAKRRLVAERLGCLDHRERRVIEGRLGLNGYRCPVTLRMLAAELGVTPARVSQIETEAAEKLRRVLA